MARLRLAVVALLAVWALTGLVVSADALGSALEYRLRGAPPPTVGMPTSMTPAVEAIRRLIPEDAAAAGGAGGAGVAWRVLLPASAPGTQADYLRQQLLYLEYPRHGDVVVAARGGIEAAGGAREVIAARGVQLSPEWMAVEGAAGFARYRRRP